MSIVVNELFDKLQTREEGGAAVSLTRVFRITGLSPSTYIVDAYNAVGIPAPNEPILGGQLVCFRRDLRVVDKNANGVIVDMFVEYLRNNAFISFEFSFSGGTNLQQVETQRDFFGNQIFVQHVYPADDPEFPSTLVTQGGAVDVQIPMSTLEVTAQIQALYPDLISRSFTGCVNAFPWAAGAPGTWLCSSVSFQLRDEIAFPPRYDMTFQFTHNLQTWTPLIVFQDERTGKPPANLVPGVGIRTVDWYPPVDFSFFFPVGY